MKREVEYYGPSSSFKVGGLPEGCMRCIKGEKIVLYTTGSCSVGCSYCPIPEDRQKVDDVYVNERKVSLDENGLITIFDESNTCLATGAGITGGDPMEVPVRTLSYIKEIRNQFGSNYHLHLYTSGKFFINNEELISLLFEAGLDELRFHPRNLRSKKIWEIAKRAKERFPDKSIGFEVPAIPGRARDLIELIYFADKSGLDFINLNEYEFTESNFNKLSQRGFVSVLTNAAVKGSVETAKEVIESTKDNTSITIHFCSSGSKDSIQLVQRFKKRATQVRRDFDLVTDEGLLQYGRFFVEDDDDFEKLLYLLREQFEIEDDFMEVYPDSLMIETADYIVVMIIEELRHYLDVSAEVITKYPFDDAPVITVDPY